MKYSITVSYMEKYGEAFCKQCGCGHERGNHTFDFNTGLVRREAPFRNVREAKLFERIRKRNQEVRFQNKVPKRDDLSFRPNNIHKTNQRFGCVVDIEKRLNVRRTAYASITDATQPEAQTKILRIPTAPRAMLKQQQHRNKLEFYEKEKAMSSEQSSIRENTIVEEHELTESIKTKQNTAVARHELNENKKQNTAVARHELNENKKQNTAVARHELNENTKQNTVLNESTEINQNTVVARHELIESTETKQNTIVEGNELNERKESDSEDDTTYTENEFILDTGCNESVLNDEFLSLVNKTCKKDMTQLTGSGYTAICHEKGITVLPPLKTLQAEVQKLIRELSKRWEKYIVEVEKSDEGIYKLIVNSRGEVTAPKDRKVFADT
ncbi:hypothetical protein CANINC_001699 [Pichia inconspicua]|uniref:Uncharacterized protein n=1 Tax=Pichia inconspicua TaxID=52247 RepID=A0A4V4NFX3_9ASCO|nr:hypothetical protein CANINC_001699 [[Candida] inconspicua]